jgi:hypothetical protein
VSSQGATGIATACSIADDGEGAAWRRDACVQAPAAHQHAQAEHDGVEWPVLGGGGRKRNVLLRSPNGAHMAHADLGGQQDMNGATAAACIAVYMPLSSTTRLEVEHARYDGEQRPADLHEWHDDHGRE